MIDEIRKVAQGLLDSGEIKVIIGYEKGSGDKTRPVFITKSENLKNLVIDDSCTNNIAVFLTKAEVKAFGKPAIVATKPVLQTIKILISENQVFNGKMTVIAAIDGKVSVLNNFDEIKELVSQYPLQLTKEENDRVEQIEKMTPEERWKFWIDETSKCTKCYACRAACPMCYCPRCTVESNQPQWINVPAHLLGNLEWHIMRAMHLAGRCSNCGACYRACPLNIPLNILTQKIINDVKQFADSKGTSDDNDYVLSVYKPNDSEDFIR